MAEISQNVFLSIRKTAERGIISEHYLRQMLKRGELPHIKSGRKVLVNYSRLIEKLGELTTETAEREQDEREQWGDGVIAAHE